MSTRPRPNPFTTVSMWVGVAIFSLGVWGVLLWSILQLIH